MRADNSLTLEEKKEIIVQLNDQILDLQGKLQALLSLKKEIEEEIEESHRKTLPFQPGEGRNYWSSTSSGCDYLYVNSREKLLYDKPLYRENGRLYGSRISRKQLLKFREGYLREGYKIYKIGD